MDDNTRVTLLPSQVLSKTEEDILTEIYKNPAVIKHLQMMAQNSVIELANLNTLEKDDGYLAKAYSLVQGKLSVLSTLLGIANISAPQTPDSQESQQPQQ